MGLAAGKAEPAGLPLRLAAAERLQAVLGGARFVPFATAELPEARDRALANRLVTTALRRHGHLDIALGQLLARGLPPRSGSFEAVLRLGLTQLLYLPEMGAHSAIFLAVEALKRDRRATHLAKLGNAVLRRAQAEADALRALPPEALFPEHLRQSWIESHGAAAVAGFATALLAGAPLDLVLRDETDPALRDALGGEALLADVIRLEVRDRAVEALPGYAEGCWWVQDVAASLPARLLALPSEAKVLDLCAAPGGKTAQLLKAGHRVTAVDNDPARLHRLEANLARLGDTAETVLADAADFDPGPVFDGVLLDAPCSATGTFRRHPEVVWHRHRGDIVGRAALQRRLLVQAWRCLKPGGTLVYCVCSLEPEEGEAQAEWLAENLPGAVPAPIAPAELGPFAFAINAAGHLRTHPAMPVGNGGTLDGFFAVRVRKG